MSNNLKIGIVMDPISNIKPQKDTTLAIMLGAQNLGASLYYMEQDDIYIEDDKACAKVRPVKVFDDNTKWYEFGEAQNIELSTLNYILMRKDPPVDKRFIHTCYMLEHAERNGVKVVNSPTALHRYNEKIFATHFPEYCPPYQISSDFSVLKNFLNKHEKIIIKPLDAMGGQGVFMVHKDDVNFEVIWEIQTDNGRYPIVAQAFIPAIDKGDKRIIIIDGKPINHALVRIPKNGSIRGNLAAGASYEVQPLNDHEMTVATNVGKRLVKEGIIFCGMDMIGDYLIEVNITSPTGLREISNATGTDLGKILMEKIL
jgi:glutathione synthase